MNNFPREKLLELSQQSMRLGFNMGVTAMRLKTMETLSPYIDAEVLNSDLLTASDIIQMMVDSMKHFDVEVEFEAMSNLMEGIDKA